MIPLKQLQIIHLSFCASIIVFATVGYLVNMDKVFFDFSISFPDRTIQALSLVAIVFALLSSRLSTYLYKKIISKAGDDSTQKIEQFKKAFLVKCALLEIAAFLPIVVFFATANVYFLVFTFFSLLSLCLSKPTKEKICTDLNLQDNEAF